MADNDRANKSLCDMSFRVTFELMKSMDTDEGWEALAAAVGCTFERMQQLKRKDRLPDGSATRALLWELGCQNYKVTDLYDKLKSIQRLREMKILENYVQGGQESKVGTVEKKVLESSLFVSLPPQLNKAKSSDLKPQGRLENAFSMSGSEINFNQPSFLDKSKAIVAGSKIYEDKIIPGQSPGSVGAGNEFNFPFKQVDPNAFRSGPTSRHQIPLPEMLFNKENFKDQNYRSLPHHLLSSISNKGEQSSPGRPEMCNQASSLLGSKGMLSPGVGPNSSQPSPSLSVKSVTSSQSDNNENVACFSFRELTNATDGFSDSKIIGEGAFGKVYKGTINHLDCAIKKLHSSTPDSRKKSEQVKSELAALSRYRHENILTLYGHSQSETELCLVYQYLVGGSLEDRLLRKNNTPPLTWERRLNVMVGACKGLNFLHTLGEQPLIHGDIKSANILLDQYLEAKLGDLGQAKYASSQSEDSSGFTHITRAECTTKLFGTRAYLPPDLRVNFNQQSVKSDVYAMGVVFLEVCSGLQAYDPNRNEHKFLVDYFTEELCNDKDGSLWKKHFQDRTLTDVPDDIFIDVLKLASKCVERFKKLRPDSLKLLVQMKDLYKRYKEKMEEEGILDSLPSSLRMSSHNTIPSCYPSTDNESQHGVKDVCPSQQMYESAQQKNIRLQQQQILDLFHSAKATKLEQPTQSPLNPMRHQQAGYWSELHSSVHEENTILVRNHPDSGNLVQSFPPNVPIPEALRLQIAYDSQPEKKKIDRLSGMLQQEESDEKTTQHLSQIPQQSYPLQDYFPQADPKKLAQLNAFDENNFGKSSPTEEFPESLECDPVKMAYLKSFDDGVYNHKNSIKKDGCSSEEKITASETNPEFIQNGNLLQKIAGQHFLTPQEGVSYTSATSACNTTISRLSNVSSRVNGNEDIGFIKDQQPCTITGKDFEQKYSVTHKSDHRPSDDSNITTELAENSSAVKNAEEIHHHQEKPGKQKINDLFKMYSALKKQTDADSCDSGNEEDETNSELH